jgi:hypothetical protein
VLRFFHITTTGQAWMAAWPRDGVRMPWEDLYRGNVRPEGPLEFEVIYPEGSERPPDLLGIGGALKAVSPRVLRALESLGATGYRPHPVILEHPVLGITIHGYQALLVHGNGGPLDEAKSHPRWSADSGGLLSCDGYYIHEDQWDGSDFFRIERVGYAVWVTERVADALGQARPKLRNVLLLPNNETVPRPKPPKD